MPKNHFQRNKRGRRDVRTLRRNSRSKKITKTTSSLRRSGRQRQSFAVSAYCPITDLDHADMAYEWQFNGVNDYKKMNISMLDYRVKRELVAGTLTDDEKKTVRPPQTAVPRLSQQPEPEISRRQTPDSGCPRQRRL